MSLALPVDLPVLVVGALLVAAVLVAGLSDRLRMPGALVSLGLGMFLGSDVLGLVAFDDADLARNLGVIALVVILFEGGLTTKPEDLRRGGLPGFVLSNLGVLVTASVTAVALVLLLDVGWRTGFLLGAIVGSTDAAAVFDLLRRTPLPRRIASVLEVESGANDPFAVVLTIGILATAETAGHWRDWVVLGATQLVGGILFGVVVGLFGTLLLRRWRLRSQALFPLLALAIAAVAYGSAAVIGASGFLAVYIAGLAIGAGVPRQRRIIRNFVTTLANSADLGLFLLLGLLVNPSRLGAVAVPALAVTAVLLFVARPIATVVCLTPFRFGWRDQVVASWAGLRGAVPIVLATFPLTAGYPRGATIFDVVFFVVLISVAVQGATVGPLVRRLGLETDRPAWENLAEALPVESLDVHLVELTVAEELPICGRALRDIPLPPGMLVTTLVRGHQSLVPTGTTRLQPDDLLVITVAASDDAAALVSRWARRRGHREEVPGRVDDGDGRDPE
ncbi:potassium/proton antiporter [Egicoccus sp. AB-alg6-2]|uniref:potassium/proton antiporter n=1 Tax=Egicoccus sp. AB-alg6-2 TaxID=3242692 RepID=UPI00359D7F2B